MSLWSDAAIVELQKKVAFLEKELADLRATIVPPGSPSTTTLHVKRK